MKIKYYGVRGSIPAPDPSTVKYGGNTLCVAVWDSDNLLILDAGTGLRVLGNELMSTPFGRGRGKGAFLFSHFHWDHIQGFPFFIPAYIPGNSFELYGPSIAGVSLEDTLRQQQEYQNFPVSMAEMPCKLAFTNLTYLDTEYPVKENRSYMRQIRNIIRPPIRPSWNWLIMPT
jgi:phosphoribosyl 1,2-cyclic phosphodiesterase